MGDEPLEKPFIVDSVDDLHERITVVCRSCGTEVDITEIRQNDGKLELHIFCIVCEDFQRQYLATLDYVR